MKILLGSQEVCGWLYELSISFEKLGYESKTAITKIDHFFNYQYDVMLDDIFRQTHYSGAVKKNEHHKKLLRRFINYIGDRKYKKYIYKLIDEADVIFLLWSPFLKNSKEFSYIKKKKKKLIVFFAGSDVRHVRACDQQYVSKISTTYDDIDFAGMDYRLNYLRKVEKYADIIYSVPDHAGLQLKPYKHLHAPINTVDIKFINNKRRIPKIVHAPSIPSKKGTDIIEATLERLKKEGVQFEFTSIRNLPNKDLLKLLTDADILIDQIIGHGPGVLAFEAMLSGCAVATEFYNDKPASLQPPLWSIDKETIYDQLKELLTNTELRIKLIEDSRSYALTNNSSDIVAEKILKDIQSPDDFDYYPQYLRKEYIPFNRKEIDLLNTWTKFVKNETWYKKYIPSGNRIGLEF